MLCLASHDERLKSRVLIGGNTRVRVIGVIEFENMALKLHRVIYRTYPVHSEYKHYSETQDNVWIAMNADDVENEIPWEKKIYGYLQRNIFGAQITRVKMELKRYV